MPVKTVKPIFQTIVISAVTSILVTALSIFIFFWVIAPKLNTDSKSAPVKIASSDPKFSAYETIINNFLAAIRKEDADTAYKSTSPVFQKLTTLEDFKKLLTQWQTLHSIPASACTLTEYSDPFTTTITGLTNEYVIVETKCEVTEKGEIKGFNVEFIDDKGTPKISFINAYRTPVTHKR